MDGVALLTVARTAGLTVWAEEERLIVRGHKRLAALARQLLSHKSEILPLLERREERTAPSPHLFVVSHAGLPLCPQCGARQWLQGLTYHQCAGCNYLDGRTPAEIFSHRPEGTP